MIELDISKYDGYRHKVLSGAEAGAAMREKYNLNQLDKEDYRIILIIPDDVFSLNSSYFSGLFQKSLVTLGEAKFRDHYQFKCADIIRENIEDGILYILNTMNLLGDN